MAAKGSAAESVPGLLILIQVLCFLDELVLKMSSQILNTLILSTISPHLVLAYAAPSSYYEGSVCQGQNVQEILNKGLTAMGGADAMEQINDITIKRTRVSVVQLLWEGYYGF